MRNKLESKIVTTGLMAALGLGLILASRREAPTHHTIRMLTGLGGGTMLLAAAASWFDDNDDKEDYDFMS